MSRIDLDLRVPIINSAKVLQVSGMFDVPEKRHSNVEFHFDVPLDARPWQVGLIVLSRSSGDPCGDGMHAHLSRMGVGLDGCHWRRGARAGRFGERLRDWDGRAGGLRARLGKALGNVGLLALDSARHETMPDSIRARFAWALDARRVVSQSGGARV